MSPARRGVRPVIGTRAILGAIAAHGAQWPASLGHEEIRSVAEAVDREHLSGNLVDGKTLSAQGRRELRRLKKLERIASAAASAEEAPGPC